MKSGGYLSGLEMSAGKRMWSYFDESLKYFFVPLEYHYIKERKTLTIYFVVDVKCCPSVKLYNILDALLD